MANGTGKTTAICVHCGKNFEAYKCHIKRGAAKFCSVRCRTLNMITVAKETRLCPKCGNTYTVKKSDTAKYCSAKCAWNASRTRVETTCAGCGKALHVSPSRLKDGRGKCCTRKCWDIHKKKTRPTITCKECGKKFQPYPSQANKMYCSRKCMVAWLGKHSLYTVKRKCKQCGKEFNPPWNKARAKFCSTPCGRKWTGQQLIGRNVGDLSPVYSRVTATCPNCGTAFKAKKSLHERLKDHCCSRKCAFEWAVRSGKFALENNASWKGGLSFEPYSITWNFRLREMIRERDGRECHICGKGENGRRLVVHHIDYNKKNCEAKNLISLCHYCHIRTNSIREKWQSYFEGVMNGQVKNFGSKAILRKLPDENMNHSPIGLFRVVKGLSIRMDSKAVWIINQNIEPELFRMAQATA